MYTFFPFKNNSPALISMGIAFIITALAGCRKTGLNEAAADRQAVNNFFKMPANTPTVVQRVAARLQSANAANNFVQNVAVQEGQPVWNKALISVTGNKDTLVIIPLVSEEKKLVNAFITARAGADDVVAAMYRSRDYNNYPYYSQAAGGGITADDIVLQTIKLENKVFGYSNFKITDTSLFSRYVTMPQAHASRVTIKPAKANSGNVASIMQPQRIVTRCR